MNLDDYATSAARHILVYGPPKSGKTALVGELAKYFRLHWFDLEGGVKTLLNPDILAPEFRKNVNLFPIPDRQTFPIAIETILKVFKGGEQKVCVTHGKVSCPQCMKDGKMNAIDVLKLDVKQDIVVIDSYSQLAESSLNWIMRDSLGKDDFDKKAGWDEYGKQGRILERIGSTIQVAPFNVIVISHEIMVDMEDGTTKKVVPIGGTSNASKVFAKYFDDVVYVEVKNKAHVWTASTTGKANVLAGSRAGIQSKPGDSLKLLFS